MTKSAEYWAAEPSQEYNDRMKAAEDLGRQHAREGGKFVKQYGGAATFYRLGRNEEMLKMQNEQL